jgi:hypothetical protein
MFGLESVIVTVILTVIEDHDQDYVYDYEEKLPRLTNREWAGYSQAV